MLPAISKEVFIVWQFNFVVLGLLFRIAVSNNDAFLCYSNFSTFAKDMQAFPRASSEFTLCPNTIFRLATALDISKGTVIQCGTNGGGSNCVFDADGSLETIAWLRHLKSEVRFVGITFRGARIGAFHIDKAYVTFQRCIFEENHGSTSLVVGKIYRAAVATIFSPWVSNHNEYGPVAFEDCTFRSNIGEQAGLIRIILGASKVIIRDCVFKENQYSSAIVTTGYVPVVGVKNFVELSSSCFENNWQAGPTFKDLSSDDDLILSFGNNYEEKNTALTPLSAVHDGCHGLLFSGNETCVDLFQADQCGPLVPSGMPSSFSSVSPTITSSPSKSLSGEPSFAPSVTTSSSRPSYARTRVPSYFSSDESSFEPTVMPSSWPTQRPTPSPSLNPTTGSRTVLVPSNHPSGSPEDSGMPSLHATLSPSALSSNAPPVLLPFRKDGTSSGVQGGIRSTLWLSSIMSFILVGNVFHPEWLQ